MTCEGCVRSVTKALENAKATDIAVDLASATADIGGLDDDAVKQVIEDAGFDFGGRA
jgi:copper chaperone CopZ